MGHRPVRLAQLIRRKKGEKPEKARARKVSPFIVFTNNTLREMARVRPSTLERMRLIPGVGEKRLRDYGELLLAVIADQCRQRGLAQDVTSQGRGIH
jgi:superfamily II DNA helicase RecQ